MANPKKESKSPKKESKSPKKESKSPKKATNKKLRPSPSDSATLFKTNTSRKGNDGLMWTVVETKSGIKRWKAATNKIKKGKSYFILDNYNRPFLVFIDKQNVEIFKINKEDAKNIDYQKGPDKSNYIKLVKKYDNVHQIFIGKSPKDNLTKRSLAYGRYLDGNSIMLKLTKDNRYVFIGERIYEFTSPEPITKFYSSVGNNDSPYPVALSNRFVYFMIGPSMHHKEKRKIGGEYVDKSMFPKRTNWSDAYLQYYELFPEIWYIDRKKTTNQFSNVKLIHNRIL